MTDIRAQEQAAPGAEQAALIDIRNVRKVYQGQDGQVVALGGVSLKIRRGEIYGIIGLSGAGKSTLIRCMNRLDEPTEGEIWIDGQNILAMNKRRLLGMRRSVSMIFQQFNLLAQRTVAKNVSYPMEIAGMKRRDIDGRVRELLKIVGLEDKLNAYPAQLSGGQKQRVAIARALACNPQVLLCDEATSALDPMTTQAILRLLQDINRTLGITIVIITHQMAVIRQICTSVAILDGGVIAEEGSVDEVFTHTRSAAGHRLFGIAAAEDPGEDAGAVPGPALRIVFSGQQVDDPIISNLVLHLNIPVNILAADVRQLHGAQYGQMLIRPPEDPAACEQAVRYLKGLGLSVEEVPRA